MIDGKAGKNLLELVNHYWKWRKRDLEIVRDPEWRTGDTVAYTSMIVEDNWAYARQGQVDLLLYFFEMIISMDFVPEYRRIMINLPATLTGSRRDREGCRDGDGVRGGSMPVAACGGYGLRYS